MSDSQSNANMNDINESSKRSIITPSVYNQEMAQWAKQKEFLKMSSYCQNKEKINHIIEKLVASCPGQINVIKRLVEYIQEDINKMVRIAGAYASNTSFGSTNNLAGTPGQMLPGKSLSPNHTPNTLEQMSSNHSISPNRDLKFSGLTDGRHMYNGLQQVIVGEGGQQTNVQLVDKNKFPTRAYDSLVADKNN